VSPRAIVTDIEGTCSSIAFVHEVLFPFARSRLADYVAVHPDRVEPILAQVRDEAGMPELDTKGCIALLGEWQDADRKIGPLKELQGLIWAEGYSDGVLQGHVYADAVDALRRWHAMGISLYVYSSGSVAAQRLLFRHTVYGDLTGLFSGHFDTGTGPKLAAQSYAQIAAAIGVPPGDILFLSDAPGELEAASDARLQVMQLVRDGAGADGRFPLARDFTTILLRQS
jgi:enolase-phosphatase E1